MQERRRFLQVLSGSMMAAGVGCTAPTGSGNGGQGGTAATGGSGGSAGSGGDTGSTTTSTTSTSSSTTSSTTTGSGCTDPQGTNVGMPSQYATNGLHKVPGTKILIGRDDGGLFARTSLCTHMGCNLNVQGVLLPAGMHCNCHGGEFDATGKATKAPATGALKAYSLALACDGSLLVDVTKTVTAETRLVT